MLIDKFSKQNFRNVLQINKMKIKKGRKIFSLSYFVIPFRKLKAFFLNIYFIFFYFLIKSKKQNVTDKKQSKYLYGKNYNINLI